MDLVVLSNGDGEVQEVHLFCKGSDLPFKTWKGLKLGLEGRPAVLVIGLVD